MPKMESVWASKTKTWQPAGRYLHPRPLRNVENKTSDFELLTHLAVYVCVCVF